MLWDSSVEGRSIWIPLGSLWKDQSWKKSCCRDQIHRFGSQTAARFLEHIAAKLLASQWWLVKLLTHPPHRICLPNSQHMTTLPTFENMYVSVTCHKLTTHSNVAMSSHMSTGTVLSSIVLLAYSFYILQRSPTIKHGHLKSRNLSSKGGGHCALRILRVGMLRHAQSIRLCWKFVLCGFLCRGWLSCLIDFVAGKNLWYPQIWVLPTGQHFKVNCLLRLPQALAYWTHPLLQWPARSPHRNDAQNSDVNVSLSDKAFPRSKQIRWDIGFEHTKSQRLLHRLITRENVSLRQHLNMYGYVYI